MTPTTREHRPSTAPTRSPSGSQARAERTRALIMDETVRCVVEEGLAAASAKHIAERAGVTWGVIQYHFGDRNGLFAAVVESGFDELRENMATVDITHGSTRDRVAALVNAAWATFSAPTSRASLEILIGTRASRDTATATHLTVMAGELRRLGAELIADRGSVRDATAIGDLLWATLRGLVLSQMVADQPTETNRERAALVDLLVAQLESDAKVSRRQTTKRPNKD